MVDRPSIKADLKQWFLTVAPRKDVRMVLGNLKAKKHYKKIRSWKIGLIRPTSSSNRQGFPGVNRNPEGFGLIWFERMAMVSNTCGT